YMLPVWNVRQGFVYLVAVLEWRSVKYEEVYLTRTSRKRKIFCFLTQRHEGTKIYRKVSFL
ncbi:MAG TPA: hypothetical protein VJ440_13185, partial [Candidatus Brocadiaceae bacterium]|nr:hypothetical protein [Candidatus Brocadiaceae bacterium]